MTAERPQAIMGMAEPDPFEALSLPPDASRHDVESARRRLARTLHPDRGGDPAAMQRVNRAADLALAVIVRRDAEAAGETPVRNDSRGSNDSAPPGRHRRADVGGAGSPARNAAVVHDHPSFVIEALPVVAYAALVAVAEQLGEVLEDDPPYLLEVVIVDDDRSRLWCRLELLPEAGSSSVGLSVAAVDVGASGPVAIDEIRDRWISGLNALDWSDL